MVTTWYYAINGEQNGPISSDELKILVKSRQLSLNDLVWKKGLPEWIKVAQIRELAALSRVADQTVDSVVNDASTSQTKATSSDGELRLSPEFQASSSPRASTTASPSRIAGQAGRLPSPGQQPSSPKSISSVDNTMKPQKAVWFYVRDGQQHGPVTAGFLKEKAISGELLPTDHLWKNGLKDWVTAGSLPGLSFPVLSGSMEKSPPPEGTASRPSPLTQQSISELNADTASTPDENSIFDIMNDPGFASAPALASPLPNLGLMSAATLDEKPRRRKKNQFGGAFGEFGYLLAAFLVPLPMAFIMAYGYGVLRVYVGYYIVWYFCIFLIGSLTSVTACRLFEKARFENTLITVGYLLLVGMFTLYIAWGTSITWIINSQPKEFERIYLLEVLANPAAIFQDAVEISINSESTSNRHGTTSAGVYFFLEALFMVAAPLYLTYKRYNESA